MDNPYEFMPVEYPGGTVNLGGLKVDPRIDEDVEFAMDVRAADSAFVLDTLDFTDADKVIHMGYSFGGGTTARAMVTDGRIAGGINLDGAMIFFWTFTDNSILVEILGLSDSAEGLLGDVSPLLQRLKTMEILHEYLASFLELTLGFRKEGPLKGPSEKLPEIDFL